MTISRKTIPGILALFVILLAACGGSDEETPIVSDADLVKTEAAALADQAIAQTATAAALLPTAVSDEPTATVTLIVPTSENGDDAGDDGGESGTLTPLPTIETGATLIPTPFSTPTAGPVGSTPCYRASFEYETIPDGTLIPKGKDFIKLWRLKNTGTCTWTGSFSVKFVEGALMGADGSNRFTDVDIPPGGYVEIEIAMTAPSKAGPYRGYWMLLSPDGTIFGVGIAGIDSFWVDIVVYIKDS
jgi:hypothetical protein